MTSWFLGRVPRVPIPDNEGWSMHVGSSLENVVVFIGDEDSTDPGGIRCNGTGFLLGYKGGGYLITARHIAESIDDAPFLVRANRSDGGPANLARGDLVKWHYHPDPFVDLAAIPVSFTVGRGFGALYLPDEMIATNAVLEREKIGVGDLCYTMGLFHFVAGHKRNLPMLFSGNIALLPPKDEKIPVGNERTGETEHVEAYLIESSAIKGASGAPVFVRSSATMTGFPTHEGARDFLWARPSLLLLGLFQGAWFLPPDAPVREGVRATVTDVVPVGLGVVVPAEKIVELLEIDELKANRKSPAPGAARQTSLSSKKAKGSDDELNPQHEADFKRLLGAAVKPPKSSDQT